MKKKLDTQKLEQELEAALNPVNPPSAFISDLQESLERRVNIAVENPNYLLLVVLISSGLFFGIVMIWFIKKFLEFVSKHD